MKNEEGGVTMSETLNSSLFIFFTFYFTPSVQSILRDRQEVGQ